MIFSVRERELVKTKTVFTVCWILGILEVEMKYNIQNHVLISVYLKLRIFVFLLPQNDPFISTEKACSLPMNQPRCTPCL